MNDLSKSIQENIRLPFNGGMNLMLRAGFIGFGRMGVTHFSILNTHPSVKIAAVSDQSKTMLSILKKYMDVEIYSDYKEMINR